MSAPRFGLYWPGKRVPEWLETFRFEGASTGVPIVCHDGFGLVIRKNEAFHVWGVLGTFVWINPKGMAVTVTGQLSGVVYTGSLRYFLRSLAGGTSQMGGEQ